jgi:hypothetical protein
VLAAQAAELGFNRDKDQWSYLFVQTTVSTTTGRGFGMRGIEECLVRSIFSLVRLGVAELVVTLTP